PATLPASTLSLHDALPISAAATAAVVVQDGEPARQAGRDTGHNGIGPVHQRALHQDDRRTRAGLVEADDGAVGRGHRARPDTAQDRKSTRLNSSHLGISYA